MITTAKIGEMLEVGELDELVALGMPTRAVWRIEWPVDAILTLRKRWPNCKAELVGVEVSANDVEDAPCFEIATSADFAAPLKTVQIWRQRFYAPDSVVFAEALWTPERGLRCAIRSREVKLPPDQAAYMAKLLLDVFTPGRPGRPNELITLDWLRRKRDVYLRATLKPTAAKFAAFCACDEKTLRRWLRNVGTHWREFVRGD
jgi:hypothetical protein